VYLLFYIQDNNKIDDEFPPDIYKTKQDLIDAIDYYTNPKEEDPMFKREKFRFLKFSKKNLENINETE